MGVAVSIIFDSTWAGNEFCPKGDICGVGWLKRNCCWDWGMVCPTNAKGVVDCGVNIVDKLGHAIHEIILLFGHETC